MRRLAIVTCLVCLGLILSRSWAQSSDPQKDQVPPDTPSSQQASGSGPSSPSAPNPTGSGTDSATAGDSRKIEPIKTPKPIYPPEAAQHGIQGKVWVQVHISETGDVANVEVISGDPALTQAAVDAVKQWKFKPFIKNGKPVEISAKLPMNFALTDKIPDTSVPTNPDSSANAKPVQALPGIIQGMLIHSVAPVYPDSAKYNRIQGSVVLQAWIGKDGHVLDLKPISGPPELVDTSIQAVRQWRYKPYILKNEPVEVQTTITVNFQLSYSR